MVRRGRVRADGRARGGGGRGARVRVAVGAVRGSRWRDADATDGRAAREAPRAFEDRIFAWRREVR